MHIILPLATTLFLMAASTQVSAQQQRVYQWKDAHGVTHYTDTPPAQRHTSRNIDVRSGTAAVATPAAATEQPQCAAARLNLARLQGGESVGVDTNGDGKPDRNLNAEERKSQLDLNQAAVKAYCGSGSP